MKARTKTFDAVAESCKETSEASTRFSCFSLMCRVFGFMMKVEILDYQLTQ